MGVHDRPAVIVADSLDKLRQLARELGGRVRSEAALLRLAEGVGDAVDILVDVEVFRDGNF
jgi:hypothetical protein